MCRKDENQHFSRLATAATETNVRNYTPRLENNAPLLLDEFEKASSQTSGAQEKVYKISLPAGNHWEQEGGDYAFKISLPETYYNLMGEAQALKTMPYENISTILGEGNVTIDNEDHYFIVLKWISGGDLESRMEDLNWTQVKNVAKGIAYALHLVHKTSRGVLVDLKPPNITLDENDRIILFDFGLFRLCGDVVPPITGSDPYNDHSTVISDKRDVFGYGVILIQLLTDQAVFRDQFEMKSGRQLKAAIDRYVDQGEDLGKFIKQRLVEEAEAEAGDEVGIPKKLLDMGVRCLQEETSRPSALEILVSFQEMGI